jgi:hypothetical protein
MLTSLAPEDADSDDREDEDGNHGHGQPHVTYADL